MAEDAEDFGAALRAARQHRGLSLTDMSRLVHYSRGYLSKVETGRSAPNPELAVRCEQALGLDGELSRLVSARARPDGPPAPDELPEWLAGAFRRPADLPPAPAHFVGRGAESATLLRLLTAAPAERTVGGLPIVLLHGMGGVGKTALAVQAAYRLVEEFPDGCLVVRLHAYASDRTPVAVADALDGVLRRLGVPGRAIPGGTDDRAALYRSLLRGRRMLVLIDDARRADQVRPLLPAGPGCAVLVTSRRRLVALDDAQPVRLDPMPLPEAAGLFGVLAGIDPTDPALGPAVTDVVRSCGLLPLTVRIAAAGQRRGDGEDLAELARRLAGGISELDDGERNATAVLAASCAELPADRRRLLAVAALQPGPDLSATTAAWLTGLAPDQARRLLRELGDDSLLVPGRRGRYHLHDLTRAYAAGVLLADVPVAERGAARRRLVTGYLATAARADEVFTPGRYRPPLEPHDGPAPPEAFTGVPAATEWLTAEQDALVAAGALALESGWFAACWQLAYVLRGWFFLTKAWDAWLETHRTALRAAEAAADDWAVAVTRNNMGLALVDRGEIAAAEAQYARALPIFRRLGDVHGEAATLGHQAWARYCTADDVAAARLGTRSVQLYDGAGAGRGAGLTLRTVAMAETRLGRFDDAEAHLRRALTVAIQLDLQLDAAMTLTNLGTLHTRRGDPLAGAGCFGRAAALAAAAGSDYEAARAYSGLAVSAAAAGRPRAAHRYAGTASRLYDSVHVPAPERARIAPLGQVVPAARPCCD